MDIGNRTVYMTIIAQLTYGTIRVTTKVNGEWEEDDGSIMKPDKFPFEISVPFELRVAFQDNTYMVTLVSDNCIFSIRYAGLLG